jgi:hypothetical protein
MALTLASVDFIDVTGMRIIVEGTVTASGNYGTASSNGDTLSFNVQGVTIPSGGIPVYVQVFEAPAAGTSQSGWEYVYNPGTTQNNGIVQVFGNGTSGQAQSQYTQGAAYASATPAVPSTLKIRAYFPKGQ